MLDSVALKDPSQKISILSYIQNQLKSKRQSKAGEEQKARGEVMAKISILLNNLILIIFLHNQSDLVSPVQIQPVLL